MTRPSTDIFAPPLPVDSRQAVFWSGLYGSSFALSVAALASSQPSPLLLVTADNRQAQLLEDELRFYLADQPAVPVLPYPDWECLAYDRFSPHQDIISARLRALATLPALERGIVIVSMANLMQRTPPREYIAAHSFSLTVGDRLDSEALRRQLETAAYRHVSQVYEHGEYAVRGGILDLFPMGSKRPLRIDLFGDEIDSIRYFDPETQRSDDSAQAVEMLPAREFPMTEAGIQQFRRGYREQFSGDPQQSPVYREISAGNIPAGCEFYMPLFFTGTGTLFDYLPGNTVLILDHDSRSAGERFHAEIADRYESLVADRERPPLPPAQLYLDLPQLESASQGYRRIERIDDAADAGAGKPYDFATRRPDSVPVDIHADDPYAGLCEFLRNCRQRVLLCAETAGRSENLRQVLAEHAIETKPVGSLTAFLAMDARLALCTAQLERGLSLNEPALAIICESQLFGDRVLQRRRRSRPARDPDSIIRSLADLKIGDPVIHESQGIGRYIGLQTLHINDTDTEFLTIEYRDGDKLYVPVMSLHLVSRYTSVDPDSAPLHKLGGKEWDKVRRKAQRKAYDAAVELLAVQALRDARQGFAFAAPDRSYETFCAGFPFEETADQARAIDDVIADMTSDKPMDRLVCGDVGFGKTEVALRAAFLATHGGYQVAIVVPTTLLAQQHYENFRERFNDFPVRVELLSRFRTAKEASAVTKDLAAGQVDIIIGTHRLLQKDVRFKNLGLMILDEEQRFGVRHKEVLKQKRSQVDILTLTATPIPRTLNLSLSGLRDISIIATPPEKRLTIRTFVAEWSDQLIREGFLREIRRGGQIYFLHNEVRTMQAMLSRLQQAIPEARIRIAHGQMAERELEQIMQDFYHQRFNVLLCTTIIESGIDIPSANTIFINNGDRFGLSQLHQLRGRVGRSHHQAYCYVMIGSRRALTSDASRRLEALESLQDLGAGFALAMNDMEIRGTGELLGEAQSGLIDEVGFSMYMELLNRAVRSLKQGRDLRPEDIEQATESSVEIDLQVAALLPEDYLPDVHTRLIIYKRIASCRSAEELYELQIEMIDRFGLLPETAKTLLTLTGMRLRAEVLGITEIRAGTAGGQLTFSSQPNIDPAGLIQLLQSGRGRYRMQGPTVLEINIELPEPQDRLQAITALLEQLTAFQLRTDDAALPG